MDRIVNSVIYEDSDEYTFELVGEGGKVKDRFWFYGPYSAGLELAEKRAALKGARYINVEH